MRLIAAAALILAGLGLSALAVVAPGPFIGSILGPAAIAAGAAIAIGDPHARRQDEPARILAPPARADPRARARRRP